MKITSGRYAEGVEILEPYLQTQFKDWWPLHYYLGMGYNETGRVPDAVAEFKKVLMINGSHLETMRELLAIYESQEDKQNIRKYSEKIRLIEEAQAEEQAARIEETEKENKQIETEESQPLPSDKIEHFDLSEADEITGTDTSAGPAADSGKDSAKAGKAPAKNGKAAAKTDKTSAKSDEEPEKKTIVKRLGKK